MKRMIIDLICILILFSFVGVGIITLHQQQPLIEGEINNGPIIRKSRA